MTNLGKTQSAVSHVSSAAGDLLSQILVLGRTFESRVRAPWIHDRLHNNTDLVVGEMMRDIDSKIIDLGDTISKAFNQSSQISYDLVALLGLIAQRRVFDEET